MTILIHAFNLNVLAFENQLVLQLFDADTPPVFILRWWSYYQLGAGGLFELELYNQLQSWTVEDEEFHIGLFIPL